MPKMIEIIVDYFKIHISKEVLDRVPDFIISAILNNIVSVDTCPFIEQVNDNTFIICTLLDEFMILIRALRSYDDCDEEEYKRLQKIKNELEISLSQNSAKILGNNKEESELSEIEDEIEECIEKLEQHPLYIIEECKNSKKKVLSSLFISQEVLCQYN
jgi:hypothetical protein